MTRTEVDFEELRWYVKQVFEEEYGINSVAKVEAAQYNPYMINITVYVREKKVEMRDLCVKIAHVLKSQGIRAGLRTELI
jgi:translation elongation factor EF-1beta